MRQDFLASLRNLLGPRPRLAVVHSSLADLAPPPGMTRWDMLFGFERLIGEGFTFALPAFTFSFCGGKPFHHLESRSEVGVLADWLLGGLTGARRTPHPIYSFVVAGPLTDSLMACKGTTTFGDDSVFELFERENAELVMLGCGWVYATQFHRYEEKAGVPYRYFKDFAGRADFGDGHGPREVRSRMFVRDLAIDPANDFTPAESLLRSRAGIRSVPLWRGRVESLAVTDLAKVCSEMLVADPLAFVKDRAQVAHGLAVAARATREKPVQVAVLGSSNVHLLRTSLEREIAALLPDRRFETHEVPYGQLYQSLLDAGSDLRRRRPDVTFFCDRLEDLAAQARLDAPPAQLESLVERYCDGIRRFHEANGGWVVVHRFAMLYRAASDDDGTQLSELVARANAILQGRLGDLPQLLWVDPGTHAGAANAPAVDFRLWHLGRFPFSEPFSQVIARRWAGLLLAMLGRTVRAIVVDLDNTLWGGVLGEEGVAGVKLGGDFPGNAYLAFQRVLKSLVARGIALTVCSKNDEDLALKAIETLEAMQFRAADLVTHRINWRPKWQNIREIAAELNLGLESILFIDDNPAEREAVRRNLPGVRVLELPSDPSLYAEALASSPWLEVAGMTAEDRKRVDSYKTRREIEAQRQQSASLEDFYASLQMRLHLQPLDDSNIARAAQLCMKTNQFNSTTRRYDQRELQRIVAEGGDVIVLGLEDRNSERENIGLLILRQDCARGRGLVDSYLMSCRVLGRGIETAVLLWARGHASRRDWDTLRGLIIETERNTPVRQIFADSGFIAGEKAGEWLATTSDPAPLPTWLTVVDGVTARR